MTEMITVEAWVFYALVLAAFSMTLLNIVAGVLAWRRGRRGAPRGRARMVVGQPVHVSDPDAFWRAVKKDMERRPYRHPEGP